MRNAFTMLELVFVIVVIGILSAIAIPKFAATRDDAVVSKARSTVAAARSALATERQKRILRGLFTDIAATDVGTNFANLLDYPVGNKWTTSGSTYTFAGPEGNTVFKLEDNKLNCTSGCSNLGF